jgi:formylglycine-generating enzyme required for sulfatase activity
MKKRLLMTLPTITICLAILLILLPIANLTFATVDVKEIPKEIIGKDGVTMVLIPAGDFQMGSDEAPASPIHTVYLDAFYMDKYEVTNAQYKKFVQATGHREPEGDGPVNGIWKTFKPWSDPNFNGDDQPVVCITHEDAKSYCQWAGKRLPTESEWEKAARGGLIGKTYVWGDSWPPPMRAGNFDDEIVWDPYTIAGYSDGYFYTAPVGKFNPNGYGLYDMAGNVWEFCSDWFDGTYYAISPRENPKGPNSGNAYVIRGASWYDNRADFFSRVFFRNVLPPNITDANGGFRCAMDAPLLIMKVTSSEASPGFQTTIQLSITDASGVASGDIMLKYDPNILTVSDVKGTPLVSGMAVTPNINVAGQIKIAMAGANAIPSGSGSLLDITFTVNSKATVGTETTIQLVDTSLYDELGKVIPMNFENGTIKIIQPCIKGDVNNDGNIKSNDATLILRIAAGLLEPNDYQKCAADVNGDGKIRSNDATIVLRKAAGLEAPVKDFIADRHINISLSETHGLKGEIISVPITVDNIDILSSGDMSINYDSKVLRAIDILSSDGLLMANNISQPGLIHISFAGVDRLNDGKLAEMRFEVLTDDISLLTFKMAELYGTDALPLNSKFTNKQFRSWAVAPELSALLQNYPNPFNPETWIPYQLHEANEVVIRIHNVSGELVRELRLGYKSAGIYTNQNRSAYWDGRNEAGERVSSGVYFYNIQAGNYNATMKMIVKK